MKEMLEEYGGVIAAVITGMIILGLVLAILVPDSVVGGEIRNLLSFAVQ